MGWKGSGMLNMPKYFQILNLLLPFSPFMSRSCRWGFLALSYLPLDTELFPFLWFTSLTIQVFFWKRHHSQYTCHLLACPIPLQIFKSALSCLLMVPWDSLILLCIWQELWSQELPFPFWDPPPPMFQQCVYRNTDSFTVFKILGFWSREKT